MLRKPTQFLVSGVAALLAGSFIATPANSHLAMGAPSETIVFDKNGKVVIPYTNRSVEYVGGGLYLLRDQGCEAPLLYDWHGNRVVPVLPPHTKLMWAAIDTSLPEDLDNPTKNALLYFEDGDKVGICNFKGKILFPAKYKHITFYPDQKFVQAADDDVREEFILRLDGTEIGHMAHTGTPDDFQPVMMGASLYTEGRRAVNHRFGLPCALMDLSCRVITPEKFTIVGGFENGVSVARLKRADGSVSCFINRNGEILKEFPADIGIEWPGRNNLYIYNTGKNPDVLYGFMNQKGEVVVPAKYSRITPFHSYYLGTFESNKTTLDIYDENGKLLLQCPHTIDQTTRKFPDNPKNPAVNLTTITNFVATREGAAVENIKMPDGSVNAGLVNAEGKWIVPPIYQMETLHFAYDGKRKPPGQYAFILTPSLFNTEIWKRWASYSTVNRTILFNLFLRDNNLIGMTRQSVKDCFGEPQKEEPTMLSYLMFKSEYGKQESYLQIKFDEKNHATAWRYANHNDGTSGNPSYESEWETRNMRPKDNSGRFYSPLVPKDSASDNSEESQASKK